MKMIERIARAINPVAWLVEGQLSQREESLRAAERVVVAIEKPTKVMIEAGWKIGNCGWGEGEEMEPIWRSMVQAIKKPAPKGRA
jgi:hypothetical protein